MQRRRLIRSGHFGALRKSNSGKKEGMISVKRARLGCKGIENERNSSVSLNLYYVIYRPDLIHSTTSKKPLVVIHGGPSIPSDYLQPMSKEFSDRCVIFYDQIGCGNSSIPNDLNFYSINDAVKDLECLIQHLKLKQFHLYGHSFGGIVAFEYSKKQCERHSIHTEPCCSTGSISHDEDILDAKPTLLSITLCSTPSNLREVEDESKLLLDTFISSCSKSSEMDEVLHGDHNHEENCQTATFQKEFVCRTSDGILPLPLQEAYKKKGNVWEGHDAIIDYVAQPVHSTALNLPPTMLLRGEYDFISEKYGVDEWRKLIHHTSVVYRIVDECAHYSMLENSSQHSTLLGTFLAEKENSLPVLPSVSQ